MKEKSEKFIVGLWRSLSVRGVLYTVACTLAVVLWLPFALVLFLLSLPFARFDSPSEILECLGIAILFPVLLID